MNTRYTYAAALNFGIEGAEHEVEVTYSVAWGAPETGAGYMADVYKYDPGSPDEVEELRLELIDGKGRPWFYGAGMSADQETEAMILQEIAQHHTEAMLEGARQREAAWEMDYGVEYGGTEDGEDLDFY